VDEAMPGTASDQLLQEFGITRSLHDDFRCGAFQFAQVFRRELNGRCATVFLFVAGNPFQSISE